MAIGLFRFAMVRALPRSSGGREAALLILAVLVGGALRLARPGDIEYKHDEAWTFETVVKARETGAIPALGMPSSKNLLNPGLSIWVFVALDTLSPCETPVDLARLVQICNTLALLALAVFVWWCVPPGEREVWIWAVFLAAVNPIDVRFHRKIWPPSLFPLPLVVMLFACWHRGRRRGAFVWGLVGALLGQIQMAGFLLAAGVAGWIWWRDAVSVRWRWWLAGTVVGAVPMLHWIGYLTTAPEQTPGNTFLWNNFFAFKFYTHWLTQPIGLGLRHAFGESMPAFLASPLWDGRPTYLMLVVHAILIAAGAVILFLRLRQWARAGVMGTSGTRTLINSVLFGYGLLMTVSFLPFFRHYLLVTFPFAHVWLAFMAVGAGIGRALRPGRVCLAVIVAGQLALSAGFLEQINRDAGVPGADFGHAYDSPRNSHRLAARLPRTGESRFAGVPPK